MERRRAAWLLSLGLMAAGGFLAHTLAYWLVAPDHEARERLLEKSGHMYMEHWRVCLAICMSVAMLGLAAAFAGRLRGGRSSGFPLSIFALVPPAGFVVQEHVERLVFEGSFPYAAALEPTFLAGILVQIPVALLVYAFTRGLLALGDALVDALGTRGRPRLAPTDLSWLPDEAPLLPTLFPVALGHGPRAPPPLLA
jgi:hypothetical protein